MLARRFVATFIGLDLAWKATNESSICWLEGETSADLTCSRLDVVDIEVGSTMG